MRTGIVFFYYLLLLFSFFLPIFPVYATSSSLDASLQNQNLGTFIFPGPDDAFYSCDSNEENCFKESAAQYMLTCSPRISFHPKLVSKNKDIRIGSFEGTLEEYCGSHENSPNCVFNPVQNTITVLSDSDNVILPLTRAVDGKGKVSVGRTKSLEGFLTSEKNPETLEDQGPNRKLQSLNDLCIQAVNQLKAVETLCGENVKQGELSPEQGFTQNLIDSFLQKVNQTFRGCALDQYADTNLRYSNLLEQIRSITGNGNEQNYCTNNRFLVPKSDDDKKLATYVNNVQPIMERAFVKAYIIVYGYTSADPLEGETFKVVPILIPKGFGMQEGDNDFPSGAKDAAFNGPLRQIAAAFISDKQFKEIEEKHEKEEQTLFNYMQLYSMNDFNAPLYVEAGVCRSPSSTVQQLGCLFALRINAGIMMEEFQGPRKNATCTFSPTKSKAETASKLYSPAKPNFLSSLFSLFTAPNSSLAVQGGFTVSNINEEDNPAKLRVFMLVPRSEFGLLRDVEYSIFRSMLTLTDLEKFDEMMSFGKLENNGFLRTDRVSIHSNGGMGRQFVTADPDPLDPSTWMTKITARYEPNGDPNPLIFGGWMTRFFHAMTAYVTAAIDSPPYEATYKKLEPYWLRLTSNSEGSSDNMYACEDYQGATSTVYSQEKTEQMVKEIASEHNIPASPLNGIFHIEGGGKWRQVMETLSGEQTQVIDCNMNNVDGSFPPLNLMLNDCRAQLGLPENGEADDVNGRNLCDMRNALEIIAEGFERYGKAADFQYDSGPQAGEPNYYWLSGFFGIGGKILDFKQTIPPYKCAFPEDGTYDKWAHVSGCFKDQSSYGDHDLSTGKGEVDYCVCAVENFPL